MNASFDNQTARFTLESGRIVLIDPLALDGLSSELVRVAAAAANDQAAMLRALSGRGLRIGLHDVTNFRAGQYGIDQDSFEAADPDDPPPGVFEIDSGTVVLIDLSLIGPVAQILTWDRYDELLRSPPDDDSALAALNTEIGRPGFAIVSADADRSFSGDGAFHLKPHCPARVS